MGFNIELSCEDVESRDVVEVSSAYFIGNEPKTKLGVGSRECTSCRAYVHVGTTTSNFFFKNLDDKLDLKMWLHSISKFGLLIILTFSTSALFASCLVIRLLLLTTSHFMK